MKPCKADGVEKALSNAPESHVSVGNAWATLDIVSRHAAGSKMHKLLLGMKAVMWISEYMNTSSRRQILTMLGLQMCWCPIFKLLAL
jgi:hypothetical protein